jgi:hypothetical protein
MVLRRFRPAAGRDDRAASAQHAPAAVLLAAFPALSAPERLHQRAASCGIRGVLGIQSARARARRHLARREYGAGGASEGMEEGRVLVFPTWQDQQGREGPRLHYP